MADFDYNNEFVEDRYSITADQLKRVTGRSETGNNGITNLISEHKTPGSYSSPSVITDASGLKSQVKTSGELGDVVSAAVKGGDFDDNNEFVETHYA
tara:strand:+ start:251 stop:541 length:291 start_codon:yes stop_codon:yes gene_type:complete